MKRISLTRGQFALVDDEDFEWLNQYKWCVGQCGRNCRYAKNKKQGRMHRLIMNRPGSFEIDHINGNGLDNRRENLRICTHSQNMQNQKPKKNQSSQYKGVCWSQERELWHVSIKYNQKAIFLGRYSNEQEAAENYNNKAQELFGQYARLNSLT